jgi:hypothetical protein
MLMEGSSLPSWLLQIGAENNGRMRRNEPFAIRPKQGGIAGRISDPRVLRFRNRARQGVDVNSGAAPCYFPDRVESFFVRFPNASRMAAVAVVPTRVTPKSRQRRRASRSRTPPAALI